MPIPQPVAANRCCRTRTSRFVASRVRGRCDGPYNLAARS